MTAKKTKATKHLRKLRPEPTCLLCKKDRYDLGRGKRFISLFPHVYRNPIGVMGRAVKVCEICMDDLLSNSKSSRQGDLWKAYIASVGEAYKRIEAKELEAEQASKSEASA